MKQPELTITEIRLTPVAVRRTTGLLCSHVVVEILTDEKGIHGIGEMSDLGHLPSYYPDIPDLTRTLNAMFVGEDPLAIEAHEHTLRKAFPEQSFVYDMGSVIRCGVDVALHDLRAKAFGLSVTQMLGGITRDRFKVAFPVFRHRKRDEVPANMARVRRMFEQGFDVIRLYVGVDPKADELFLKTLRDEFQERIRVKSVDYSNLLDWKSALQETDRLKDYQIGIVESPAPANDFEGLREFRLRSRLLVSEHCWSFRQAANMIRERSVDILNVCTTFIGGIGPARKLFAMAEVDGVGTLIGTTQELSIGTAAQAHLACAVPNLPYPSDPTGPCLYAEDVTRSSVVFEGGYLRLPQGAGLGVELDPEKLARLKSPLAWVHDSPERVVDRTATERATRD